MLFNLAFQITWRDITEKRNDSMKSNNDRENDKRRPHKYNVGNLVLLNRDKLQLKLNAKFDGPYKITKVYTNGIVKLRKNVMSKKVSIRRILPYRS